MSLPLDFDYTDRLINNKLKRKVRQIPKDSIGLIYIQINIFYFFAIDIPKIIRYFSNQLTKYPNILGIVIYSKVTNDITNDKYYFDGLSFYGTKKVFDNIQKNILFIFNEECDLVITPKSFNMIYNALL